MTDKPIPRSCGPVLHVGPLTLTNSTDFDRCLRIASVRCEACGLTIIVEYQSRSLENFVAAKRAQDEWLGNRSEDEGLS